MVCRPSPVSSDGLRRRKLAFLSECEFRVAVETDFFPGKRDGCARGAPPQLIPSLKVCAFFFEDRRLLSSSAGGYLNFQIISVCSLSKSHSVPDFPGFFFFHRLA